MSKIDLWTITAAILSSVSCALIGCFLVLRKMSLMGDAISHAILPGLAFAFIITGSREILPMAVGALAIGIVTTFCSGALSKRVPEDAAIGVVFSFFFAVGVLLISWVAGKVDLDPGCVLYGLIEFIPFDTVSLAGLNIPRAVLTLGGMLIVTITFISLFFKELALLSFDQAFAQVIGLSTRALHYGLMGMVAAISVTSFEAVGSILVVAMMIAPAVTAHLLTDRLRIMLILSAVFALTSSVIGYYSAVALNTSIAGMMSVIAGLQFIAVTIFAPRYGVVSSIVRRLTLSIRIMIEDILAALFRKEEQQDFKIRLQPLTWTDKFRELVAHWILKQRKLVSLDAGQLHLTESGRSYARHIVRSHRLWETFLSQHSALPPDHLHDPAHRVEHFVSEDLRRQLEEVTSASSDPHGKEIPPEK